MTRDIIDINNFLVLIEHSYASKTTVAKCHLDEKAVGFAFYGSGAVELDIKSSSETAKYNNTSGIAISFYGKNLAFNHTISPETPLQSITIFSTLKNIKKLSSQEQEVFEQQIPDLINPTRDFVKGPDLFMTPDMKSAVSKIFASTYTGSTRLMFLKSQVTELLSHFFANIGNEKAKSVVNVERDKLYQAREILANNIAEPPSLNQLAKQIGLNSYKLKKNFKELFGVPVFKHLQNERLIKAHDLLRENEVSVQEAAWKVGYESLSSFSNAFFKKFGFRPSDIKS